MITNTLKLRVVNWNSTNHCAAYQYRKQSENWPHNIHQATLKSLCLTFTFCETFKCLCCVCLVFCYSTFLVIMTKLGIHGCLQVCQWVKKLGRRVWRGSCRFYYTRRLSVWKLTKTCRTTNSFGKNLGEVIKSDLCNITVWNLLWGS
jgi:hypothetical protein